MSMIYKLYLSAVYLRYLTHQASNAHTHPTYVMRVRTELRQAPPSLRKSPVHLWELLLWALQIGLTVWLFRSYEKNLDPGLT